MNKKLLTIITFLVLVTLYLIQSESINDQLLRGHLQEKQQIKGQLISQYGIGVKGVLQILIDNQKEVVTTDEKGIFQVNVKDKKESEQCNLEISINAYIPGYLYSNPIMKKQITISNQIQLPTIIIQEGGFGALKIIGQLSEKINNIHLFIEIENNNNKYQSHAITNSQGQFNLIVYGINKLPILGELSIEDDLQIYEPIKQQKLTFEGQQTIVDIKTIQLQQSKSCRIQGCKTCNQNNQKCQECTFGYQLTSNQFCKFGTFKGTGKAEIQLQNFGKVVKIVGTLVNNKLEPINNQLICMSSKENENLCLSTGGTKLNGEFEIEIESLREGQQILWFKVNEQKQEILIDGKEQVMNIGIITIY